MKVNVNKKEKMIISILWLLIDLLLVFDQNESQLQMIALEMFVETKVHVL